jgi:hypothetical protein
MSLCRSIYSVSFIMMSSYTSVQAADYVYPNFRENFEDSRPLTPEDRLNVPVQGEREDNKAEQSILIDPTRNQDAVTGVEDLRGTRIVLEPAGLPDTVIDYIVTRQSLKSVLAQISRIVGVPIDANFEDNITVERLRFEGDLEDALNTIASAYPVSWMTLGQQIIVFGNAQKQSRFIDLLRASPNNIVRTLQNAGIGGPGLDLLVDQSRSFIRATGPEAFINELQAITDRLQVTKKPTIIRYGLTTPQPPPPPASNTSTN